MEFKGLKNLKQYVIEKIDKLKKCKRSSRNNKDFQQSIEWRGYLNLIYVIIMFFVFVKCDMEVTFRECIEKGSQLVITDLKFKI